MPSVPSDPRSSEEALSSTGVGEELDEVEVSGAFVAPPSGTRAAGDEPPPILDGPYEVFEKIGHGGFGIVFRGRELGPAGKPVAIKVLKPGMDSAAVLARFDAEQNALSRMNHPGIARCYGSGLTRRGRSFFAMELVEGVPISDYCRDRALSLAEKLTLFREVCGAIQHAHDCGVLHRDLKPANILVGEIDGKPTPKVIDFGLAKALDSPLTEHTLATEERQFLGTLEYMSPEQASRDAAGFGPASDLYALGVVLHELLVGEPPFSRTQVSSREELLRQIREIDPARPSSRRPRRSRGEDDRGASGSEEVRLLPGRELPRDLDWIVLKALEKEPARRYGSPRELSDDLGRLLEHRVIRARPPSVIDRLRKMVRRNRASLTTFLLLLLATGGASWAFVERRQAIRESGPVGELRALETSRALLSSPLRTVFRHPEEVRARKLWIAEVQRLVDGVADHQATLEGLREATPAEGVGSREQVLAELLARLQLLQDQLAPAIRAVERAEDALSHPLWAEVLRASPELPAADPGLLPLGRNGQGLQEFALVADPTVVFVLVPGGAFTLDESESLPATGSSPEVGSTEVRVSPFLIARTPITNAQYERYRRSSGLAAGVRRFEGDLPVEYGSDPRYGDHPAVNLSWTDLHAEPSPESPRGGYLRWAGLVLPTEAEWRWAAGGSTAPPWGEEGESGLVEPRSVMDPILASRPGRYGTIGQGTNISEWCFDRFAAARTLGGLDPTGPRVGERRRVVGGNWRMDPAEDRPLLTRGADPGEGSPVIGFRPVRPLPSMSGDFDGDGRCDRTDSDDDGDGLPDLADPSPLNPDADGDGLLDGDDPSVLDSDGDGDGIPDGLDPAPLDPFQCGDSDQDGCDDCTSGVFDPMRDGPDEDGDGTCDSEQSERLEWIGSNEQGYPLFRLRKCPEIELVRIPGGPTARLGADGGPLSIEPYFIATREVTNRQYRRFLAESGTTILPPPAPTAAGFPADHFTNPLYDDHPVVLVSWADLHASDGFLAWAGLELPDESEWEHAAAGGRSREFPWGVEPPFSQDTGLANLGGSYDSWPFTNPTLDRTLRRRAGPFGTFGQGGNVAELCRESDGTGRSSSATLRAWDGDAAGYFGLSLALDEDTLVIGAPLLTYEFQNAGGCVYVYRHDPDRGGWRPEAHLSHREEKSYGFGSAVAIFGDHLAIGAPLHHEDGDDANAHGAVFMYRRAGGRWTLEQTLQLDRPSSYAQHGISLALDGEVLAVGAYGQNTVEDYAGVVTVYEREGSRWVPQQVLTASDPAPTAQFGRSVAIAGDSLLVGADGAPFDGQAGMGSAYLFQRDGSGWREVQRFQPAQTGTRQAFGTGVALGSRWLAITSPADAGKRGSASVYREDASTGRWTLERVLRDPAGDDASAYALGYTIDLRGDRVLLGASQGGSDPVRSRVFRYDPDRRDWIDEPLGLASPWAGAATRGILGERHDVHALIHGREGGSLQRESVVQVFSRVPVDPLREAGEVARFRPMPVARGASWRTLRFNRCLISSRIERPEDYRDEALGFRPALRISPGAPRATGD